MLPSQREIASQGDRLAERGERDTFAVDVAFAERDRLAERSLRREIASQRERERDRFAIDVAFAERSFHRDRFGVDGAPAERDRLAERCCPRRERSPRRERGRGIASQ